MSRAPRAGWLAAWLFALAGPAHALTVTVSAPDALRPLLERYLDAARAAQTDYTPGDDELARLTDASVATARELLATEGYFSPVVHHQRLGDILAFSVDPGPRTRVTRLDVRLAGDDPVDSSQAGSDKAGTGDRRDSAWLPRIRDAIALAPGQPFRQADWDRAKSAALTPFASGSRAAARIVHSAARIDPEQRSAELEIVVDPGPAFRVGAIEVAGARRYPADLARRYSPLSAGKPVRSQDLLDYQTALETSGYYTRAAVRIEPDASRAGAVPVSVELTERPLKSSSIGLGISTDTGPRIKGEYRHRNLDGKGLQLGVDVKIEQVSSSGGLELALPRDEQGYDHTFGLRHSDEDVSGQKTRKQQLSAKRSRQRGTLETTYSLLYQNERQTVGGVLSAGNQALTLNTQWTLHRAGRGVYPARGYVSTLGVGGALASVLSDTTFLRLYARHTQFFRVNDTDRVVARVEGGAVLADTRDGIPTDFLFRAGGDNSVRGYAYQSLGRDLSGGVASVRYLATASIEYQHFFLPNWGAAVFVDAGDAADSPAALSPVAGYGAGARWRSPVGPVNLDVAYGQATGNLRLHFSLGVTF